MSILRRAVTLERRAFPAAAPWDGSALTIPSAGSAFGSSAGVGVDDTGAMSIVTFYAGLRIIADAVSTTPIRAVTINSDGSRKPVIPSPQQIVDPFEAMSLEEGVSQVVTSLILRGNAYLFVQKRHPVTFKPVLVRVISPDIVSVSWDKNGYRQYTIGGRKYDGSEVLHLTGFMLPGTLTGAGLVEYCRNALGIGMALEDVAGSYFANGLMSTGIISVDAPLSDDQSRQAAEMFQSRHSGTRRAFKPIVLGGGAKFSPISLSLEDAQFLESRQFTAAQMATLLGIPPHLLGIVDRTTSWGTGIEVQGRAFVDYTLRPYFTRLQTMFTEMLDDGTFADFITDVITRADTETRFKNYQVALGANNGVAWMTVNEVRASEGLPKSEGGDVFYVSSVMTPATDAQKALPGTPSIPATDPSTGAPNGNV